MVLFQRVFQDGMLEYLDDFLLQLSYSFVEVRDESYDEPKNHHKGQILTYQLAVRGHNRKLRDENMQIKKIIWIAPYTKGPEGAPFYDTRHEVTAKKIWAEKALFANIY